jgi:2-isopropylmalate synthase
VEWFGDQVRNREALILSVHTHNDRGGAVAAAELALMAGADRVEGTLLGNGERTGNMDIVTLAMNLYSQGVDPVLDLSGMDEIVRTVEAVTRIPIHPRHPYAGELVYTAFSGSHQDAIRKCIQMQRPDQPWEVAYLPIDPADLGRSYEEVIRINSQSGKGGVAYVLERDQGITLPRWVQIEFSKIVQQDAEASGREVTPARIWELFRQTYLAEAGPYRLQAYHIDRHEQDNVRVELVRDGVVTLLQGSGAGALEALVAAMQRQFGMALEISAYEEHAVSGGTDALAACFVQLKCDGERRTGVALHRDSVAAVLSALLGALNRHLAEARAAA